MTTAPTLRLLRAPVADPPYDDELAGSIPLVEGSLALAFPPTGEPVSLRLVPPATIDDELAPRPTPRSELPDPRGWTGRIAQAIAEILDRHGRLLEIAGESPFRTRAYTRAAETIQVFPEHLAVLAGEGRLREVPGVGEGLAAIIEQMAKHAILMLSTLMPARRAASALPPTA